MRNSNRRRTKNLAKQAATARQESEARPSLYGRQTIGGMTKQVFSFSGYGGSQVPPIHDVMLCFRVGTDGVVDTSTNVYVALPPALQRFPYHGKQVGSNDGHTYTYNYASPKARTSIRSDDVSNTEAQAITPEIEFGELFTAVEKTTGFTANGTPVTWEADELDGDHHWAAIQTQSTTPPGGFPTAAQVTLAPNANLAAGSTNVQLGIEELAARNFVPDGGTAGQTLQKVSGADGDYAWGAAGGATAVHTHLDSANGGPLDAAAIATGTMATARLGSGTADNTKFLRGDQTWNVPGTAPFHFPFFSVEQPLAIL